MNKTPSIKDLSGQRLMLGFEGPVLNDEVKHLIKDIRAGGLILFKTNVQNPEQLAALCRDCQTFAAECGLPPLIMSIDQEGGTVARLREGFTQFDGNPSIFTVEEAEAFARITAEELTAAGINMNLAPVLDLIPVGEESIMKDRAFKGDAQTVSLLGRTIIKVLQEKKIMAVGKHFPGIGRTVLDSHFHLPELSVSLETLEKSDLIPFKDAMAAEVAGMMLSHIFYPRLDHEWQASLSPQIANGLLREGLGYDGLVMTDDLDMKAIGHDMQTCIRQILLSRIDMALICHSGPNIDIAFQEIQNLLKEDPDLYNDAILSYGRILGFKKNYLDC